MASEIFVWAYLPGDVEPTLCGRFEHGTSSTGHMGVFAYYKSYLQNPSAIAVDPIALPLRALQFSTTLSKGVFGALLDAMPESWGRHVIDTVQWRQDFPARYMLNTAGDAIGNLAFSQSSTEIPVRRLPIGVEDIGLAQAVLYDLDKHPELVFPEMVEWVWANTAMGGARPKLTVEKDGRLWLAKFPSRNDDANLPMAKLEAAMLDLARRCGINSAISQVVEGDGRHGDVLLVERFDRGPVDGRGMARRDAFLSARTLFECTGFRSDYSGSYVRLASELERYSCQSESDRAELFRRMVFNALISNTDDHDRNHGLVADDMPGTYRLSPAYDLLPQWRSTRQRGQAMAVGSNGAMATKENLLSECEAFGLTRRNAEEVHGQVAERVAANWRECLVAQGVADKGIALVEGCFSVVPDLMPGRKH
ncbi:HipA-like protein [Acidovorax sp. CF316]|uniref:type II toxin-antitoxin system HipA family toxin n=1 Tax=Acidovorax sp. CF316 TaxID=1144317 RepID=UPI00026BD2D2|nr:HipA domain-containing protein [Acidovorax sp. CF316]EJE54413.1 HipA-like protein [Acidovorax sp. CF316]